MACASASGFFFYNPAKRACRRTALPAAANHCACRYSVAPHFHGINTMRAYRFGLTAAGFAGAAGIFALFFFAEVPKVRDDIVTKIPIIGDHFRKEIPPEDNPF